MKQWVASWICSTVFSRTVDLLRPESVGQIRLVSPDPMVLPGIDPNILATEGDMALGRAAIRAVRNIFIQKPFDALRGRRAGARRYGADRCRAG